MRKVINFLLFVSLVFWGCGNEIPKHDDFIGVWRSKDSATIKINSDGTFTGKNLPKEIFRDNWDSKNKKFDWSGTFCKGQKVDGSGKWNYKEGISFWEKQCWKIELKFDKISDEPNTVWYSSVLVEGEGFWGNKPPWHLFEWVEEEGGERYIFRKQ